MSSVSTARAETQALIARVDTKAALLLAFNAAASAGVWTVAKELRTEGWQLLPFGVAGALLLASVVVSLHAVRPRFGDGQSGFLLWSSLEPSEVEAALAAESEGAHLVAISKINMAKMRTFQKAIDLTVSGLAVAVLAAVVQAATVLL